MANSATFQIRRVKCRDEMGGSYREKFGNDEIKCAVFSGDLRGKTQNSGRIDIYDNFDDGDVKVFNPPRPVVTLDLAGATGEVELAFAVLLIESQVAETNGVEKAYQEFIKTYQESLKEELSKRQLTSARADEVAQPGYLSPSRDGTRRGPRFRMDDPLRGSVPTMGTSSTGTATAADEDDLMDPFGNDDEETIKEEENHLVRDAFLVALATTVAAFVWKTGDSAIMALVGWSQDKFFPPVAINAKFDASAPSGTVPAGGEGVAEFRGHDGIYEMEWEVVVA